MSTGGLQKITISCPKGASSIPEVVQNISEIESYGCRHINLEEIIEQKKQGNEIMEVSRPDPSLNIRSEIYKKTTVLIKDNPIMGIGWGSISSILGVDNNGAGLNASNLFIEVWLGSGILGFAAILLIFGYLLAASIKLFLKGDRKIEAIFILISWVAIVVPNIFNSGIFLAFLWAYLATSVSLLQNNKAR